jgi:hypothetical protein
LIDHHSRDGAHDRRDKVELRARGVLVDTHLNIRPGLRPIEFRTSPQTRVGGGAFEDNGD